MSFRAKSKEQQWVLWACALFAGLALYVIASRLLYGSLSWDILDPRQHRIFLTLLALLSLFASETRWDGIVRKKKVEVGKVEVEKVEVGAGKVEVEGRSEVKGQRSDSGIVDFLRLETSTNDGRAALCRGRDGVGKAEAGKVEAEVGQVEGRAALCRGRDVVGDVEVGQVDGLSGDELYVKARELKHQPIPDFEYDAEYLELLGQSAEKGSMHALAKLGEYAMRRRAWVEAYYWMKRAQRKGMRGLDPALRNIRACWINDGFPNQSSNENKLFTAEAGSIGRALLHIDTGHDATKARAYLKAHHPEHLGRAASF